jgi:hypothetical protein
MCAPNVASFPGLPRPRKVKREEGLGELITPLTSQGRKDLIERGRRQNHIH